MISSIELFRRTLNVRRQLRNSEREDRKINTFNPVRGVRGDQLGCDLQHTAHIRQVQGGIPWCRLGSCTLTNSTKSSLLWFIE